MEKVPGRSFPLAPLSLCQKIENRLQIKCETFLPKLISFPFDR